MNPRSSHQRDRGRDQEPLGALASFAAARLRDFVSFAEACATVRGCAIDDQQRVVYSTLHGVKPAGRSIGLYRNRPFHEAVIDDAGRRFTYVGLAPRKEDGTFDARALKAGEFIVPPGLVYRHAPAPAALAA